MDGKRGPFALVVAGVASVICAECRTERVDGSRRSGTARDGGPGGRRRRRRRQLLRRVERNLGSLEVEDLAMSVRQRLGPAVSQRVDGRGQGAEATGLGAGHRRRRLPVHVN